MSYLPPVLTGHQITGSADHTTISLAFNEAMGRGSGMVIVTDGAIQTVIDRSTGLPTLRVVGATETHEIPVSMVGIDGNQVMINADGLTPGHQYRVFIAPGVLQSNGQPFAGVTSSSLLAFSTPADATAPALLDMRTDNYALTSGKGATLTMVFSESVVVDQSALVAPNVTVTGLTGSADGRTWHATITPVAGIETDAATVSLDMRGVHDTARNQGSGMPSLTYAIDTKAPAATSITLFGLSGLGGALTKPATVTVKFSEKVNISDPSAALIAPHASLSDFHSTDGGTTWVGTVTPESGSTAPDNQLYVDMSKVLDQFGNPGSGVVNLPATYDVDTVGPAITNMTLSGNVLKTGGSLTLTFELHEGVSVEKAAIIAPNAIVGDDLHTIDNGRTWIVTLTPQAGVQASDNTLSIDMSQIRDVHNVPGSGFANTPHAYDVDSVAPAATLSLSGSRLSGSSPVFVTITFTEAMKTLDKAAITAGHATVDSVTSSDGGITWIAKLLPTTQSGTNSGNGVSLDMSKVFDLAGNSGTGTVNATGTYDVDADPPTTTGITLNGSHATSTSGPTMTVKFSEAVSFDAGAFATPHATLSNLHSDDNGITWTATVLADGTGNGSINVVSLDLAKVHDSFGNPSGPGTISSTSYDVAVTAPTATITLSGNRVTQKGTVTVTVKFNEAVKDLDPSYFHFPNADLSTFSTTDHITWQGTLSSNANLRAIGNTFSLDMTKVQDMSGNFGSGTASASGGYDVDTQAPTATLTLDGNDITATHGLTLTVQFSEPVSTLDASYFTAANATISNLTRNIDGSTWTATLTASGSGNTTGNHVSLDMTKVQDLFGNAGSGSVTAPTAYSVEPPLAGITLDGTTLMYGDDIMASVRFASKVPTLDPAAITAGHATVVHLHTTDGGYTWYLTLTASDAVASPSNVLSIDMTKVVDETGHAGTGTVTSPVYAVDTLVASYAAGVALYNDTGGTWNMPERYYDGITKDARVKLVGVLDGTLTGSQTVEVKIDGTAVDIDTFGSGWSYRPTIAPKLADGNHVISVRVIDGEHASAEYTRTITVDTRAPQVTSTSGDTTQAVDQPLVIHLDEAVSWNGIIHSSTSDVQTWNEVENYVKLVHGATTEYVYINQDNVSSDGRTITISANDLQLSSGADYQLTLPAALTDVAGNSPNATAISFRTSGSYADTAAPRIMSAMAVTQGEFGIGTPIKIAVKFNEPVKIASGNPELTLNNGAKATYDSTSADGRTIYFVYTVAATDTTPSSHYLDITGMGTMPATVTDMAGNKLASGALALSTLDGYYPYGNVSIDTSVPSTIASAPVLDASSDSGTKGDLITSAFYPTLHGTGATPGSDLLLFDVTGTSTTYIDSTGANADGSWDIYGIELGEGTHHLAVVQANAVGNRGGASSTLTLTIDRTANKLATPVLDGASDSGTVGDWITAVTTPKLVGTGAEAGAKVEVREGATVLGSATADSDGSWSFNLSTLGTGKHSLSLRQIDVADNISADTTFDLTIDPSAVTAVAPPAKLAAPVLSSADTGHLSFDGITKEGTLAFSGTGAVANATIDLLQDGAVVKSVTAGSNGAWSVALSTALVDGSYAFAVRQTDSGHHQSESSEALHITVDTTAPGQPGISQSTVSDTGASHSDGITSYDKPIFSGTGADANATIDLYAGTTLVATGYADASGNWSVQPPAAIVDGTYSFTVRQSDLAGNTSVSSTGVSVTIDTHVVAPSAPVLADASDTGAKGDLLTADNTPSLSGGGCEANADVEIFDGTTLLQKVSADADGKWTYTLGTLLDGVHQLSVRQTDLAGNVSASSTSISLKVDTAAPAALLAPALSSLSDSGVSDHDGITKITTPTFTGSGADANTRIELYDGATLVGFTNSDASGNYAVTVSSLTALSDGAHGLSVRQVDGAGNASANSSTVSVTIDTAAPQLGTPSSPLFGTLNIPFNELVSHSAFGTVEIYASSNILQNSYTGSATNAWTDVTSGSNPYSVLHLNISQGSGSVTVSGTVQDLAGNVTVIGATSFPFSAPTSFFQPLPLY